jgi:hypothetical protein
MVLKSKNVFAQVIVPVFKPLAYELSELQFVSKGAMIFALMFRCSRKQTNVR